MAGGEYESVAVRPGGIRGDVFQESIPNVVRHSGGTHGCSRVASFSFLHRVDREETDAIDTQVIQLGVASLSGQIISPVQYGETSEF